MSLWEDICALPQLPADYSFGADIDAVHQVLHSADKSAEEKMATLREWLAHKQPCLFGRLASKGRQGLILNYIWINESDLEKGDDSLKEKLQSERRAWKIARNVAKPARCSSSSTRRS